MNETALREKIMRFVQGLSPGQLILLEGEIRQLVVKEGFEKLGESLPTTSAKNVAVNTFKPEDTLDYYYGR